jgi:hypothetical protein
MYATKINRTLLAPCIQITSMYFVYIIYTTVDALAMYTI